MNTTLMTECAPLIGDSDLYLSQLALQLCKAMLAVHPQASTTATIKAEVWSPTFQLLQSPLLQNSGAERAVMELCAEIVRVGTPGFDFQVLLPAVKSCVVGRSVGAGATDRDITRQALSSLAQCVATMCETTSKKDRLSTVDDFVANIGKGETSVTCLSLLSLGEIGRRFDLSGHAALEGTVIDILSNPSEEIKNAGSFCLGNVSVGCMDKYLPIVIEAIQANPNLQYLLLHSLKEIIKRISEDKDRAAVSGGYIQNMLPLLFENAASPDEGVRNVVAECLGKIALCEPTLLDELKKRASDAAGPIRQTIVTAIRHAVVEAPHPIDEHLQADIGIFLGLVDDKDLNVKRSALLTLNTLTHSKIAVVRAVLGEWQPLAAAPLYAFHCLPSRDPIAALQGSWWSGCLGRPLWSRS